MGAMDERNTSRGVPAEIEKKPRHIAALYSFQLQIVNGLTGNSVSDSRT